MPSRIDDVFASAVDGQFHSFAEPVEYWNGSAWVAIDAIVFREQIVYDYGGREINLWRATRVAIQSANNTVGVINPGEQSRAATARKIRVDSIEYVIVNVIKKAHGGIHELSIAEIED